MENQSRYFHREFDEYININGEEVEYDKVLDDFISNIW
jgi:hypothetical protein